jgi:hypothetical protein
VYKENVRASMLLMQNGNVVSVIKFTLEERKKKKKRKKEDHLKE